MTLIGYIGAPTDERAALQDALTARLRGVAPTIGKAYADCSLRSLELLANLDSAGGLNRLAGGTSDWAFITGFSFSSVLAEVYRKQYSATAVGRLARPTELPDFRKARMVGTGGFPSLQRVGESGEVAVGSFAEVGEYATCALYARRVLLSQQVIANDDANAFAQVVSDAALAAAFVFESIFYDVLLANAGAGPTLRDGNAFFHSSRGNLLSASTLDATNLGLAVAALRGQTEPTNNSPLNFSPFALLIGPGREVAARALVASITPYGSARPIEVIADPRLGNQWYLFADPAVRPAFLSLTVGRNEPFATAKTSFEALAIAFRISASAGVAAFDPRACVRNPGA